MSEIIIINNTDEAVRLALYQKPVLNPNLNTIAWRIADPPPGGRISVPVPFTYAVYAEYGDPNGPVKTVTNTIPFEEPTAHFLIEQVTPSSHHAVAHIVKVLRARVLHEVVIDNKFGQSIEAHISRDGDDIYAPGVILSNGSFHVDIRATLYLAVVGEFTHKGDRLVQEEISSTERPILEGQTATVTGSKWDGYNISVS